MLEYIRIQNFKSLKDVTLNLKQINLLIGANNSGKSNLLKALEFIGKILFDKEKILSNQSDYNRLVFDNLKDDNIDITVKSHDATVSLRIESDKEGKILFDKGTFDIDFFQDIKIYKPEPSKFNFDSYLPEKIDEPLGADVRNFIPFLFNLRENHRKNFRQLEKDLHSCLPDFFSIAMPAEGGKLRLKLFTDKEEENFFWAEELSEGVLYFLALLCIVHQPNPPKLLLLEEPEKGIHPRRISEVVRFIQQLAEDKDIQVIMTTHSPIVLEEFAYDLESIFVFDKEDKATIVRNLQHDIIEPHQQKYKEQGLEPLDYQSDLSNYWLMGFLNGIPDEIKRD